MRRVALLVVALALLATVAGATTYDPVPVCGYCGDFFEAAAADSDVDATVEESRATVQVHANGSATWRVRNNLSAGAEQFREDPSRLVAVGQRLASSLADVGDEGRRVDDHVLGQSGPEPRLVDARMDGDTAVLVIRDPDAAERHAGLLVLDYFHHGGEPSPYVVNTEVLTVIGPPGTVVANSPGSGTVEGRTVTWTGVTGVPDTPTPRLDPRPLLVYGPSGGSAGTDARTSAAVFLAVLPLAVDTYVPHLVVIVPWFAVVLAGVVRVVGPRAPAVASRRTVAVVAGGGGVGGLLLAVMLSAFWLSTPALLVWLSALGLLGLLLGGIVRYGDPRERLRTPRDQALVVAGALAGAAVTAGPIVVVTTSGGGVAVLRGIGAALPLAAMLPQGAALPRDRWSRFRWGAVPVLAFAVMLPLIVNFARPILVGPYDNPTVWFPLAGMVFPLVGAAVLTLGRVLAGPVSADGSERRPTDV